MTLHSPVGHPHSGHHLRLLLSGALFVVAAVSVVAFALAGLPTVLVVALSLIAALALVDFAGTLSSDRPVDPHGQH